MARMRCSITVVPLLLIAVLGCATATATVREPVIPNAGGALTAGPDRALWLVRGEPLRLVRFDGRRARDFPLPTAGSGGLVVTTNAAVLPGGTPGSIVHVELGSGATTVTSLPALRPGDPFGQPDVQAVGSGPDGVPWVRLADGRLGRVTGAGVALLANISATDGRGAALTSTTDGRLWLATDVHGLVAVDVRTQAAAVVDARMRPTSTRLLRVGSRILATSGTGLLAVYGAGGLVRERRGPALTSLALDARGVVHGLRADGTLVRVDTRLRQGVVLAREKLGRGVVDVRRPEDLNAGPSGRLWAFARGDLVQYVRRPTTRSAAACRFPAGAWTQAAAGRRVIALRTVGSKDGSEGTNTLYACGLGNRRPRVLRRWTSDVGGADESLTAWRFAGHFAMARHRVVADHYGSGRVGLVVYDLRDGSGITAPVGELFSFETGYGLELEHAAVGPTGAALYLRRERPQTIPGPRAATLVLVSPAGAQRVLSSGMEAIDDLVVSATTASWRQDGERHSVPLR